MPNRLQHETSPYLLQHADNPVDWHPWNEEALNRAREEDKPIFLSIGYSACHWCHVMEHESFENESLAAAMNENFVCIKVDREERPDLDQIYMNAVQLLTGRGGWPMSVFLTPDQEPFYGGTYWPPIAKMGMPGFGQVLEAVVDAWQQRRAEAMESANKITNHLRQVGQAGDGPATIDQALLQRAAKQLEDAADLQYGGFGQAPKFPHPMNLRVALRVWYRTGRESLLNLVRLNLDKMAQGGIYDHLGGGFARYSVDKYWLVPHFEKMLYDNALLTVAYIEGYQATGDPYYAQIARETCNYVLNDLTDPEGGFHSSEDADSEGQEGKFYVWELAKIEAVLGAEKAERFCKVYDVTDNGNFDGANILNLHKPIAEAAALHGWDAEELQAELAASKQALLQVRNQRVRPGKDDKVLTSWNGLMIEALARTGVVLNQPTYVAAAQRAAQFVLQGLRRDDGRLLHSWRGGKAKLDAYLDDYSYLIQALSALYEADFDERWIDQAVQLADLVLAHFQDRDSGGFYFTADDHEKLIARHKDVHDSSVPSGNGMAATALLRLARLSGRDDYQQAAMGAFAAAGEVMQQSPIATGQMLLAADFQLGPAYELVFISPPDDADLKPGLAELRARFIPNYVVAAHGGQEQHGSQHLNPLFEGKQENVQKLTLYACERFVCGEPASGLDQVRDVLERLAVTPSPGHP